MQAENCLVKGPVLWHFLNVWIFLTETHLENRFWYPQGKPKEKSYLFHRALNRNESWQHLHLHQGHVTRPTVPYISEGGQERSTLDVEGSTAFLGDTNGDTGILGDTLLNFALPYSDMKAHIGMSNWWDKGTKNGPHLLTQYGHRLCSKCIMVNVEIIWLPVALPSRWKWPLLFHAERGNIAIVFFQ